MEAALLFADSSGFSDSSSIFTVPLFLEAAFVLRVSALLFCNSITLKQASRLKSAGSRGKKYFSVASGGGTGRTLHPDNMAAGPASYGMTDTMGRMHSDAQFAGSSSVPAHVEMMGLIGMGNNPMVGATVAVAVAIEEACK